MTPTLSSQCLRLTPSILCVLAGLLVTGITCATPIFEVGAGGGDGSEPITARIFFDGQGTAVESGSLRFSFDPNVLQATESCTSRIGDPLPDRVNFTHRVNCSVDNTVGEVLISFSPFSPGFTVFRRLSLGRVLFTVSDGFESDVAGTRFPLDILSVTFPNHPGTGSVPGQISIFEGWPMDSHEPDDSARDASRLSEFAVNQFLSVTGFVQAHTLDSLDLEDWAFFEAGSCMPLEQTLRVSPVAPFSFGNFRPIVTLFSGARLVNRNAAPLATYGDCNAPAGRDLVIHDLDFSESTLIRVSNCETLPEEGFGYSLRLSFGESCPFGLVTYRGTVSETDSDTAAGVFLRSSDNQYSASSPATGRFSLVALADQATDIEVLSDQHFPTTVSLPPLARGVLSPNYEVLVTPKGTTVFSDSFE